MSVIMPWLPLTRYNITICEFVTVTKIGTGLSDEQWRSIRERTRGLEVDHKLARVSSLIEPSVWVEPQIVIEVLADEYPQAME